jgi:hypothetical protein
MGLTSRTEAEPVSARDLEAMSGATST